jgi:putative aldouronate transport system permease protein
MKNSTDRKKNPIRDNKADVIFNIVNYTIVSIMLILIAYPMYFVIIASVSDPHMVNRG